MLGSEKTSKGTYKINDDIHVSGFAKSHIHRKQCGWCTG